MYVRPRDYHLPAYRFIVTVCYVCLLRLFAMSVVCYYVVIVFCVFLGKSCG